MLQPLKIAFGKALNDMLIYLWKTAGLNWMDLLCYTWWYSRSIVVSVIAPWTNPSFPHQSTMHLKEHLNTSPTVVPMVWCFYLRCFVCLHGWRYSWCVEREIRHVTARLWLWHEQSDWYTFWINQHLRRFASSQRRACSPQVVCFRTILVHQRWSRTSVSERRPHV